MLGAGGRRFSADLVPGAPPVPLTLPAAAAPSLPPRVSQTPDRSGSPSKNFGAGAVTSTLPSAVRGTPGSAYRGHCAEREIEKAPSATATAANWERTLIGADCASGPSKVQRSKMTILADLVSPG